MEFVYKVIVIMLLIFFGTLLIAQGACTIEWTRQGGIVVNGKKEVVTTAGQTVEVATQEEEKIIETDRKGFLQAMSAINIIVGIFLFVLAGYFATPDSYKIKQGIDDFAERKFKSYGFGRVPRPPKQNAAFAALNGNE